MAIVSYQYLQQSVIASLTLTKKDDETFFNPTTLQHTGFAFDGFYYSLGTQDPNLQASWFREPPSDTRGIPAFPTDMLVVLSEASMSLMDTSNDTIALWMLFYYLDVGAFPNNFTSGIASFTPQSVSWANGLLSVVSKADPGSPFSPYCCLTVDFTQDTAYVDYSVAPTS